MTYLYHNEYIYLLPFDERENSYDTFRFINYYVSYRLNNDTGFLTEKFNLLLRNFSFNIVDINYEGRVIKQAVVPELADNDYYTVKNNNSWVRVGNMSSKTSNASGILLAIVQKLGTAIDNYREPKTSDYPTYQQIANKQNANGEQVPYGHFSFGLYYSNISGFIEFFNLEELTKYQVFYTTADEDPSSFFREGQVVYYMMVQTQNAWIQNFQVWIMVVTFIFIAYFI
eukprot:TRINITY_DN6153_c0_g1_i3.p5 TRINITY_DN6153_c0_g1~~TRINITY_DN6153_c0_g1_i3.p5  ORF type:complete len:228 (+),score=29.34 TRINITY_DN6153_c0_g1_i3:1009-1692(+)